MLWFIPGNIKHVFLCIIPCICFVLNLFVNNVIAAVLLMIVQYEHAFGVGVNHFLSSDCGDYSKLRNFNLNLNHYMNTCGDM